MFCSKCGKDIGDAKFCSYCGASVENEGTDAKIATQPVTTADSQSIVMTILSFLIPLVGFIYYGVKHKEMPSRSQSCLFAAIGGAVVGIILYL